MKLWLARHARPLVEEGVCYGALDVPADAAHTRAVAAELARSLPTGLAVSVSPLQRCTQLAAALHALRPDLVPRADARLREMDFGCWEGQPWAAVEAATFDAWDADFGGYRCGGGECVADFMQRVDHAYAQACASDGDALWITHAGVFRALHLLVQGVAPASAADWPRQKLDFGGLGWVTRGPAGNRCSHLFPAIGSSGKS